jgi:hypothetical protein
MSFVVHRVAKSAARYTDAGGREKCGYCRFFIAPRACGKVIGPVSPRGWCKYFSRQVAQQYSDAGITGGGGPPGMTLDLNFMFPGSLPPGVTFTRASTATYTDASGVIQTAAVNQPRWDYAGGSLRGLLIEEARTNIALQSGDLANATWQSFLASTNLIMTANQTIAPDGTMTAASAQYSVATAAGSVCERAQGVAIAAGVYTFSVWMKGVVGGERLYLLTTPDNATYYRRQCILTTAWQRFTLTTGTLTAATWYFCVGVDLRDTAQTGTPAQTIYVWGADIERGPFATSYIPTTSAAVTRAADIASMPTNASWFGASAGSFQAEFIVPNDSPADRQAGILSLDDTTAANQAFIANLNGDYIYLGATVGSVAQLGVNPGGPRNGLVQKAAFAYGGGQWRGAAAGVVAAGAGSAVPFNATRLVIGSNSPTLDLWKINGCMRGVLGWKRTLSDAELISVTT